MNKLKDDSVNAWKKSLGLFNDLLLASGSMVPIEAEGKEMVETPDTSVYNIKGSSHEDGGVDLTLPQGSKIYSKRVKVNGVSMADRKKAREDKRLTLEDLMSKNSSDQVLKNTYSRVKQNNAAEDDLDTQIQTMLHALNSIPRNKYATGGFLSALLRPGNLSSIFGDLISALGPSRVTQMNRAADTPNINPFANFGQRGLQDIKNARGYLTGMRDNQMRALELSRESQIARNNNSARGINTLRALNLATDQNVDNTRARIDDSFARNNMDALFRQANMENQQDRVVMEGERQRDLADRMDKDNYYTQVAANVASQGRGFQELGRDLNDIQRSNVMANLVNHLSRFFEVDANGNIVAKNNSIVK